MRRGALVVGLSALLTSGAASADRRAAPASSAVEGPALPPSQPVPKASPEDTPQPVPKASPEDTPQPVPKASPRARQRVEGPAPLPEPTGARTDTARPWLRQPTEADADADRGSLALSRQRDGSQLYVDPGKRFTASVNADGSVRFGNRWGRDQHHTRMRGSGAALRGFGPSGIGGAGVAMTGPTEWLLALSGQETDAAAKTEFLNRTLDLRIQLAIGYTLQLLDTRLGELSHELMGLWADGSRTLAQRRAIVFQRWDECDERLLHSLPARGELPSQALSAIDDARLGAADRARRTIEGFIRRQMPAGTPRAYTPAELADFNRRRVSAETFAPYQTRRVRASATSATSATAATASSPVPQDMSLGAAP